MTINKPLETACVRIKLKEGALTETKEWFQTLMERKDEVLKLLKEEGVFVEAAFLDRIGENYYLIYFMKVEDRKKSSRISSQSEHPINKSHQQYKKRCWEEKIELESLLDLDRIQR